MKEFSIAYFIFITVASVGVIQFAASRHKLDGLMIFRSLFITRMVSVILPIGASIWFFTSENRNISDHLGGLSGNAVALTFFLATATGWLITAIISSAVHTRAQLGSDKLILGITALQDKTYFRALQMIIHNRSKIWPGLTK